MERINVTKTFLPPIEEYQQYVSQIWDNGQITNQGPLLEEFEGQAKKFLNVDNFQLVTNGTLALQIAISALDLEGGEVITTPFSYVASTSAILWEKCKPVFVDIEPDTFCIDADKIEAAITKKTKAILPVHVFGFPCDVEKIDAIAKKHGLKVIYDAAHAFGAKHNGKSLMSYGDISVGSFHATKLFHTIEGGCIIPNSQELDKKIDLTKRFGHSGYDHHLLGINAKASEFQAAMGLCNLKYVKQLIAKRKVVAELYDKLLDDRFYRPAIAHKDQHNYAYYPVLFDSETQLEKAVAKLQTKNIYPRRYFYPSLNSLRYVNGEQCPISEDISLRVLCLPLYADLPEKIVKTIARTINET